MNRRVFQFKCESCGAEEDVSAEEVENFRQSKKELGGKFEKNDWVYCLYCGWYAWRMWNPPAISFKGGGFTKGT